MHGPFDPMEVGRNTGLSPFADRRVNSAVSVNSFHRLGFGTSGLRLDNPAMVLTNSWFLSETGRKRPPANVAGARFGGSSRTRAANQRRGSRQHLASCGVANGERCARTEKREGKRRLAAEVKQRVSASGERPSRVDFLCLRQIPLTGPHAGSWFGRPEEQWHDAPPPCLFSKARDRPVQEFARK
jgi:hypothetical protein